MLEINCADIEEEVFQPVVDEVLELIEFQLEELRKDSVRLDYIILVGGFGQSQYLKQKVEERFNKEVGSVVVPSVGELAVTRGAVLFGLDPYSITHRKMKITYGFGITAPYEEGLDKPDLKVIDKKNNKVVCKNRFDVCVKKGQEVSLAESKKKRYYTFNSNTCHLSKLDISYSVITTIRLTPFFLIELYGFKGDTVPRYVSDDPDAVKKGEVAYKVADFVLELPDRLKDKKEKITFEIEIFFGHMEIRVVVDVPDKDEKLTFMAYYENEGNLLFNRQNNPSR